MSFLSLTFHCRFFVYAVFKVHLHKCFPAVPELCTSRYVPIPNGDGGIRTLDLSDANRTLSQLSYRPICKAGRSILSMTNVLRLTYYTAFWRNCQAGFSGFSVQAGLSFPGDAKGRPKQSRRTSRHWRGGSVLWMHIGEYQGESLLTGSVGAAPCRKRRSESSMDHCISKEARGHCSTMRIRAVPPSI